MLRIFRSWRHVLVIIVALIVCIYSYNQRDKVGRGLGITGVQPNTALDAAQHNTEVVGAKMRDAAARAGSPMLARGEVGILSYLSYKIVKPFVETRLDYYVSQLGFNNFVREHLDAAYGLIVRDLELGSDDRAALCGSTVDVLVRSVHDDYVPIATHTSSRVVPDVRRFTIGQGSVERGIELGTIGMKVGGVRRVTVPPNLMSVRVVDKDIDANKVVMGNAEYDIKLLRVLSSYPQSAYKLYTIDSVHGIERRVLCGDKVLANIKIMDSSGDTIYERGEPFYFRAGIGRAPVAIELGALAAHKGSRRLIVAPRELMIISDDMDEDFRKIGLTAPGDSMVEISILDVVS